MRSLHAVTLLLSISILLAAAVNDLCVCNKAADPIPIFDQDQQIIGDLKPNECKAFESQNNTEKGWLTIRINKEVGYVKKEYGIALDLCMTTQQEDSTSSNITLSHALRGSTKLCPTYGKKEAEANGYLLTQNNHACYEIYTDLVNWIDAEHKCKKHGGHLVTIQNVKENTYLHEILHLTYHNTVWIGLNDRNHEENFQWVTGENATYTNWKSHRKSPDHRHEDCVIMYPSGLWDDVACGDHASTGLLHHYAYMCEYGCLRQSRNLTDMETLFRFQAIPQGHWQEVNRRGQEFAKADVKRRFEFCSSHNVRPVSAMHVDKRILLMQALRFPDKRS